MLVVKRSSNSWNYLGGAIRSTPYSKYTLHGYHIRILGGRIHFYTVRRHS